MPLLVIHCVDDQIVPIDAAGRAVVKLVPGAVLHEVEGGNHGYAQTNPDEFNAVLADFLGAATAAEKPFILASPTVE